jgi:hypothetical protein
MLARFERLLEQAVEGSLRRVFPTTLQPVQLAKAAARAMEQAQLIGIAGPEVPNDYRLRVSAADMARFAEHAAALTQQMERYLANYARERHLHPVADLRVELVEDDTVRSGSVRAEAHFVGLAPGEERKLESAFEDTRRVRLADLQAARPARLWSGSHERWVLADSSGLRYSLELSGGLVRMGRAPDNDVVIESKRVSRYHAQARWIETSWLVYDLESTNGTWLDGERVLAAHPRALRPGARLRLGDHELEVREGETGRGLA